jgi:hypothetical protein
MMNGYLQGENNGILQGRTWVFNQWWLFLNQRQEYVNQNMSIKICQSKYVNQKKSDGTA